MGHVRLGSLPRTRRWKQVVALIEGGAAVDQVANASLRAAEAGLRAAATDPGVIESFWLLTQVPIAARTDDFAEALRDCNVVLDGPPSILDLAAAVSEAVDARLANCKGRTDLGEMAQSAAVETLSVTLGTRLGGLFEPTPEDVRTCCAGLRTVAQFGGVAADFFGRFVGKCLDAFLSRELPLHVGEGRRFATLAEQATFTDALALHCREAAVIVERYAGEWASKALWLEDEISRPKAAAFTDHAMKKLIAELKQGALAHAS